MKRIGIITSGGDSPGMNAAIRGAARAALGRGAEVVGFHHGYEGIINDEVIEVESRTVGGIIAQGGTIPVSYTHLDVYKRQVQGQSRST